MTNANESINKSNTSALEFVDIVKKYMRPAFLPEKYDNFVLLRVDLADTKNYVHNLDAPFDDVFSGCFRYLIQVLTSRISNAFFAYTVGDNVYLVYRDTENHKYKGRNKDFICSDLSYFLSMEVHNYFRKVLEDAELCSTFSEGKVEAFQHFAADGHVRTTVSIMPCKLRTLTGFMYKLMRDWYAKALLRVGLSLGANPKDFYGMSVQSKEYFIETVKKVSLSTYPLLKGNAMYYSFDSETFESSWLSLSPDDFDKDSLYQKITSAYHSYELNIKYRAELSQQKKEQREREQNLDISEA